MHLIELRQDTLHSRFSKHLTPVLTITSGESVLYRTIDVGWGWNSIRKKGTIAKNLSGVRGIGMKALLCVAQLQFVKLSFIQT